MEELHSWEDPDLQSAWSDQQITDIEEEKAEEQEAEEMHEEAMDRIEKALNQYPSMKE